MKRSYWQSFLDSVQRNTHRKWVVRTVSAAFLLVYPFAFIVFAVQEVMRHRSDLRAELVRALEWMNTGELK